MRVNALRLFMGGCFCNVPPRPLWCKLFLPLGVSCSGCGWGLFCAYPYFPCNWLRRAAWEFYNSAMDEFDVIVVGGGSGGYAAARTAAGLGLRTAVIEGGREVGGLCILRGCMPSKTLLESAKRYRTLRRAGEYGLQAEGVGFDARQIAARKRELIAGFADYRRDQLMDGRFAFFRGHAEFSDPHTVVVRSPEGNRTLRGRAFVLATGSVVSVPDIPGLVDCLTSDDVLEWESLPKSLIVLGGGPVGLEVASFCRAFGVGVTIIQRSSRILREADCETAIALEAALREDGIEIFTETALRRVEKDDGLFRVTFQHDGKERTIAAEQVLNALGRHAALEGLQGANIKIVGGRPWVSTSQQTSTSHIFAAGDVCGPLDVVHLAIQQGEVAARNIARYLRGEAEELETMDYRLKLFVVFTHPELAVVGASEQELDAAGIPFFSATYPFSDHGKSLVMGEVQGMVKLIAAADSREILGASVVGPEASDLIHEIVVAMHFRATVTDLASIPHYHPTLSEIWTYPAEELANRPGLG